VRPFEKFMASLTDPQEKLAAFLTGHICGQCRCSNHSGYTKPDMQDKCECYQEAGRIIEMLRPMYEIK